ncbi:hypothetical protein NQ314_001086 [Rhamnusium bicolor]|uniref:Ribosomal protein S7 n=1 Tax=Rhamnusium bicolor TaxID=1586634 RepID=A0AAV8ZVX6_9CUCU|nr:hypothetical protein NQ314_001086 [Rhamnusium bicolor]
MDLNIRKRTNIAFSIAASKEVLWKCDLLPANNDDVEEEDLEVHPVKNRPERLKNYVERIIPAMQARQFQSHFRINRQTFEVLVPLIDGIINKKTIIGRNRINTEKQLLAVLWILATPDSYRYVLVYIY